MQRGEQKPFPFATGPFECVGAEAHAKCSVIVSHRTDGQRRECLRRALQHIAMLAAGARAALRQRQRLPGLRCLSSSSEAGLFGIERLQQPEDWRPLVEDTKARSAT